MNKLSINELRAKAAACRKIARTKTGSAYVREMEHVRKYEELARSRETALHSTNNGENDVP